jgi:hypothetical protein
VCQEACWKYWGPIRKANPARSCAWMLQMGMQMRLWKNQDVCCRKPTTHLACVWFLPEDAVRLVCASVCAWAVKKSRVSVMEVYEGEVLV